MKRHIREPEPVADTSECSTDSHWSIGFAGIHRLRPDESGGSDGDARSVGTLVDSLPMPSKHFDCHRIESHAPSCMGLGVLYHYVAGRVRDRPSYDHRGVLEVDVPHWSPQSSPRLHPVVAATVKSRARSGLKRSHSTIS